MAGCAFAKDMLKALLAQAKRQCPPGRPQDYVDDTTLQVDAKEPGECAQQVKEAVEALKEAFEATGASPYKSSAHSIGVHDGGVTIAKDLAVSHYGYGGRLPRVGPETRAPPERS